MATTKIIDSDTFCDRTALLPDMIAETLIQRRGCYHLTVQQAKWFVCHCDFRTRYLYSNNPDIKKKLNSGNRGRDWCYQFFDHWLDGFLKNIERYRNRHLMSFIGATDEDVEAVQLSTNLVECLEWNHAHQRNDSALPK